MGSLPRGIRSWLFRSALDDIEMAYEAAAKAHANRPNEIEADVRRHLGLAPDDPFPQRDDDDEDDPLHRLYDDAGAMQEHATRGAHLVRKAFLIALFHHWERYCNSILKREKYGHPKRWLQQRGHPECVKPIRELEAAANCAKHGPGNACRTLYRMRPDLFPRVTSDVEANENSLQIDEQTLKGFFSMVREACL